MKKVIILLLISMMTSFSACEMFEDTNEPGDFQIVRDGKILLDQSDIEYYDFSTHVVYLKDKSPFKDWVEEWGGSVMVNGGEIYTLSTHHPSSTPIGAHILSGLDQFGDYAFRISFGQLFDGNGNPQSEDQRNDQRIIETLKRHNKYRAGLSAEIQSIDLVEQNKLRLTLTLTNNDDISYYHLDPEKTGIALFHYFTNGLTFFDRQNPKYIYPKIDIEKPESISHWDNNWLSIIQGGESKTFELVYDFETIPQTADLHFTFEFPGLSRQITDRQDLNQPDGRIWLGSVQASTTMEFD